MIIRLHIHKIFMFFGFLLCFGSLISYARNGPHEAMISQRNNPTLLIIDPGHGGSDGGAVGIDGTVESGINLEIALKLDSLAKLCGVPTKLTRYSEEIDYPPEANSIAERKVSDQKARLRLIQDYPYAILYSIHQNTFPSEKVSGIQVLYGHSESSKILGDLLQTQFNQGISTDSRRAAAEISDDIFLMKHCTCASVLIECGFISNYKECKLLQTQPYQKKLIVIMLGAYMQYTNS